ncbi:hypothetical protein HWV23_12870 [Natronomonas halophila]|uniref:hypothetical protein n=1 Tax=Natronomonas halophila TaxID=2747817 RepID=UPI0015B4536D|nr:hypothetical protein [Natronomonas halophila]QLD86581.1 hypothetical protein HWV23_12870 [Natronomonas halophila]
MGIVSKKIWGSLEQSSAWLFFLSSGLFFFNAIYELFQRLTPYLGDTGLQNFVIYISGLVVAVVGVLGFYRRLTNQAPRLAGISLTLVAVGTGSLLTLIIWAVMMTILNQPLPPGMLIPITVGITLLGLLLFGVTILWTRTLSRTVGGLLLGFVGIWILGIATISPLISGTEWLPVVLLVATGVFPLTIGYLLPTDGIPTDHAEPTPDPTTK